MCLKNVNKTYKLENFSVLIYNSIILFAAVLVPACSGRWTGTVGGNSINGLQLIVVGCGPREMTLHLNFQGSSGETGTVIYLFI
jgi:hypothetical protein